LKFGLIVFKVLFSDAVPADEFSPVEYYAEEPASAHSSIVKIKL